jgi:hypothetical protein
MSYYHADSDFELWYEEDQTAAPQGSGCLSGFVIPPAMVLLVGLLLAFFSSTLTLPAGNVSASSTPLQAEAASGLGADVLNSGLAQFFTPEVQHWGSRIQNWAAQTGLDPNLIATVMQIESCGDPRAKSSAGAMGLFQVMPYHFYAADDPYDPDTNAQRGLAYLRRSLDSAGGDARLALAGYNGGIGIIPIPPSLWATETLRYVRYGGPIYEDARQGAATSTALDQWFGSYGAGLCRQARQRLGIP